MKQIFALAPLALLAACYGPPPPPPPITPNPPGGVYRAAGTEPFWSLTVDEEQMVFTDPNSNAQVSQPTPSAIVGVAGEIYQTPRINLNIVHAPCNNGMSDRTYPDKVQVTVDGRPFKGCGGAE
jgi:heat shock protein HslJ